MDLRAGFDPYFGFGNFFLATIPKTGSKIILIYQG
jgi:hypothetical protein